VSVQAVAAGEATGVVTRSAESRVRQDLARELHDRVAQTLTAMIVEMEVFKGADFGRDLVIQEVTSYQEATREVLTSIREILYDLRGEEEDIGGDFEGRVRRLLERFEAQSGIDARLTVSRGWPRRLTTVAAVNLYRLVEEALNNVRRHSAARHVRVSLQVTDDGLATVSVQDDGVGISPAIADRLGFGVRGMEERALLLGGRLRLEPTAPRGTLLTALIPKEKVT
jgi:two-component system sensor histidine kinase DegS